MAGKIKMTSTAAGPNGTFQEGKEYPADETTKKFVPDYAYYTEKPEGKIKGETAESKPEKLKEEIYPKYTDGGWYELSNGEKVQGKKNAIEAEKKIS